MHLTPLDISYDDDGRIIGKTGDLIIKNYNGEKELNLGILMQAGADNVWKSLDYNQTQKEDR